jgi:hypothetical protein
VKGEVSSHAFSTAADSLEALPLILPAFSPVWLLAEDFGHRRKALGSFWLFETDTEAAVHVLGEHHLFEYYVVQRHLAWMVAENHHNVLIAVGEPVAARLESLATRATDNGAPTGSGVPRAAPFSKCSK